MRTEIVIWFCVTATSIAVLGFSARQSKSAWRARDDALAALQITRQQVETLRALRNAVPVGARDALAKSGLATRVTSTLEGAGLSGGVLSNFSPEREVVIGVAGDIRVIRGRATILLAGLSLAEVGKFLDAWRAAEPRWVATSIDLAPAVARAPKVGGDLPLRVVIVIESLEVIRNGDGL